MDNSINYGKLDEAVKRALVNSEAKYDTVDWAKMESMLDVAPKQISLPKSNSSIPIIALIAVGLGLLLYILVKPSETTEKSTITTARPTITKKTNSINKPKTLSTHPILVHKDSIPVKKEIKPITPAYTTTAKTAVPSTESIKKAIPSNNTVVNTKAEANKKNQENHIVTEKPVKTTAPAKADVTESKTEIEAKEKRKGLDTLKPKKENKKKEIKKEYKEETVTISLEEENDSNLESTKATIDTSKSTKAAISKEKKNSKKSKKINKPTKDSIKEKSTPQEITNPDGTNKNIEDIKKDTLKNSN